MNKEDVKIVASAMIEDHWQLDESGKNCFIECRHCRGYGRYVGYDYNPDMIVHKLDCPVLVAKDLLT